MIRASLDKDNFMDLGRLWYPLDNRPFYRVAMSLNRFKFLLRCMRFANYRNQFVRQKTAVNIFIQIHKKFARASSSSSFSIFQVRVLQKRPSSSSSISQRWLRPRPPNQRPRPRTVLGPTSQKLLFIILLSKLLN